jgi:hypothetical protein
MSSITRHEPTPNSREIASRNEAVPDREKLRAWFTATLAIRTDYSDMKAEAVREFHDQPMLSEV